MNKDMYDITTSHDFFSMSDLKQDELRHTRQYLEKIVDGTHVILDCWSDNGDIYVTIGLGGQIRPKFFKRYNDAKIYYDSINHDIIRLIKNMIELNIQRDRIRSAINQRLEEVVFSGTALGEFELI